MRKVSHLDLTGQQFGFLVALDRATHPKYSGVHWRCRCICGAEVLVPPCRLLRDRKSCGCKTSELQSKGKRTHGCGKVGSRTPEYMIWCTMRRRCNNPRNKKYPDYGGRGITICPRWDSFENFLADLGARPSPEHSLDRRDNDGPYDPKNCRWATLKEQASNKRSNRILTHNGLSQTLTQWAKEVGIKPHALMHRLDRFGWSVERALTTPVTRPTSAATSGAVPAKRIL